MKTEDARLIEAVIDDDLDALQQARLLQRLDDPAFIAALGGALSMVGALRAGVAAEQRQTDLQRAVARLLLAPGTEAFTDRVMHRLPRRSRGRTRRVRRPRRLRSARLLAVAAMALLALGVVAVAVGLGLSGRQDGPLVAADRPLVQPVLWRVISDQDALIVAAGGASRFGRSLVQGDELRSQDSLRLRRQDGSQVTLEPDSVLRIPDGTSLHLAAGRLQAQVRPQGKRHPFLIHTAHCRVRVLGTVFSVAAEPQRSTVAVSEGRVRVTAGSYQRSVAAGEDLVLPGPPRSITGLALVEAPGGRIVRGYERIVDGQELLLRELPSDLNFVVGVADGIAALRTTLRDDAGREIGGSIELNPPFSVFGDEGAGRLLRWHLQPGRYLLRIEAYTDPAAQGEAREVVVYRFTVSER